MPTQFPAIIELSDLNGANGFKVNGVATNDFSGISVSAAGDVNGDGLDDIVIGAYRADPNGSNSGQSYVVFGSKTIGETGTLELSNLNGANGFRLNGVAADDSSGRSVSNAGDVNNDGIGDFIIGARGADPNGVESGQSYVIFGDSSIGSTGTFELSNLIGANGFRLNGVAAYDYSGEGISSAGDINSDNIDDLIIGSPGKPSSGKVGTCYVVFGNATFPSTLELSDLNGNSGFVLNGGSVNDRSGFSVSSAGDINFDGINDLLIGARWADPNGPESGQAYVVFGDNSLGAAGTIELTDLSGTNGFKLNGIQSNDQTGKALGVVSDFNGDGIDDLIIAAYTADPNGSNSGKSYVIFGGVSIGSSGTLELSNLNGSNGFQINGIVANDYSGISISAAGDINADGYNDLIVGASGADPNGASSGQSYAIFGSGSIGSTGVFELSSLNGSNGFKINGIAAGDNSGVRVSNAGDVNGDGGMDLLIGAFTADPNGRINAGQSYIIFGEGITLSNNQLDINENQSLTITETNVKATDAVWSLASEWAFSVFNDTHGQFESALDPGVRIDTFTNTQITNSAVRFVHDGSEFAPSYSIGMLSPSGVLIGEYQPAQITYSPTNTPPIIVNNIMAITEGGILVLTSSELSAVDSDNNNANLLFTISVIAHGQFELATNPGQVVTEFAQGQVDTGNIRFIHDGSEFPPLYKVAVTDGSLSTNPASALVIFTSVNDAPKLESNNLNIIQGQTLIVNSGDLKATDTDNAEINLQFEIGNITHGQFERFNNPGVAIHLFRQQNILDGDIRFIHDGSIFAPDYGVIVSDGQLQSAPSKVKANFNLVTTVVQNTKSNTVRNAIIGSTVSGFVGLLFLAIKIYVKRKSDRQMQKALEGDTESAAGQRAQYFKEVVSPVAKKIFSKLSIRNFFGISDKKLGEFFDAVAKLVDECQARGVPVNDLPNMEPAKATNLINEIAKQTKQVLAPTSSLTGTIVHFFKRQVTPEQIEDASVMIASFVKTAWDSNEKRVRSYSQAEGIEMTSLDSNGGQDNPVFMGTGVGVAAGTATTAALMRPSESSNFAELLAGFKEEFLVEIQGLKESNQHLETELEQLKSKQNLPPPIVPRP